MTSRERVLTAFDRRTPDRVPRREPGLVPAQHEVFREKTGRTDAAEYFRSDLRSIGFGRPERLPDFSRYYLDIDESYQMATGGEYGAEWGIARVDAGFYHFSRPLFPMRDLTSASELDTYPFPDFLRDWRHDHFESEVQRLHDAGFPVVGSVGHIFQTSWLMRSSERAADCSSLQRTPSSPKCPGRIS